MFDSCYIHSYPAVWIDHTQYGLIIASGIVLGVMLALLRETRLGLPKETGLDLALIGVPAAILGARLYFVVFSWELYADNPISALYIWEGGMAIYGGIIGAVIAGTVYSRIKKLPFLILADLAAPSIALGQAVGRWGNFVNQEAYGRAVENAALQFFPVSVFIDRTQAWHYAAFFYESLWCALIVVVLLTMERRGLFRKKGDTFFTYIFLYGLERAFVEGLRTDSLMLGPVRVSQALSLAIVLFAAFILFTRSSAGRRFGAGMFILCVMAALLLIAGHTFTALICAALALICAAAMYINDRKIPHNNKDKAMIK